MADADPPLQRLGAGRAAEVFAWDDATAVKLSRWTDGLPSLQTEAAALSAARAAGIRVPAPRGFVTHDGRPGLLLERLAGDDLLSIVEKKPWRVWEFGRLTGRLHAELGKTPAPDGLRDLRDALRGAIAESSAVPERARPRVLALLDSLPVSDRLCHGDFHPGNIILTGDGPVVIDFPNAVRGDPVADFARSTILLEAGEVPPDTGLWGRVLVRVGRKLMLLAYRSGYRTAASVDADALARWRVVIIAHRLTERVPEERVRLLRMLSRGLRTAGA
ncbi:MAG: phosphotransferase [Dehalococcoidia bacterium]|nr:phosphotransferase [Dehalococcoidia bacterium]